MSRAAFAAAAAVIFAACATDSAFLRGKAMIVWMNFDRDADHWVDTSRIGKRIP